MHWRDILKDVRSKLGAEGQTGLVWVSWEARELSWEVQDKVGEAMEEGSERMYIQP